MKKINLFHSNLLEHTWIEVDTNVAKQTLNLIGHLTCIFLKHWTYAAVLSYPPKLWNRLYTVI